MRWFCVEFQKNSILCLRLKVVEKYCIFNMRPNTPSALFPMAAANFGGFFFCFFFGEDMKKNVTSFSQRFWAFLPLLGADLEIFYHICITRSVICGDLQSCYFPVGSTIA